MSPKLDSVPRMVNPIITGVLIFWRLKKIDLAGAMPETSSGASKRPRSASPVAKDDSCGDTIKPEIAAKRCVAAVSKPRVNERATSVTDLTVEQLMTDDGANPVLFVPSQHYPRILRLYGGHTMLDFDELYDFNVKIGSPYPNCYKSMMYYLNVTHGNMRDQWEKVRSERVISDIFNIVQSAVHARVGECVWYE